MRNLENINKLYQNIRELILEARSVVSRTVNFVSVIQNWEIGRMIVEVEQKGKAKAEYGKYIIKELAEKLTAEFGSGYSETHLKYCRKFYQLFPISHALRDQLQTIDNEEDIIRNASRSKLEVFKNKFLTIKKLFSRTYFLLPKSYKIFNPIP